jgi:hypothetical protein
MGKKRNELATSKQEARKEKFFIAPITTKYQIKYIAKKKESTTNKIYFILTKFSYNFVIIF